MKRFLVVESRDLTEYTSGTTLMSLVEGLGKSGDEVVLFLLENGVIAARKGADAGQGLSRLSDRGTRIFAEDVSCRARGITALADGVRESSLDFLADAIAGGFDNIVWY